MKPTVEEFAKEIISLCDKLTKIATEVLMDNNLTPTPTLQQVNNELKEIKVKSEELLNKETKI